MLFSFQPLCGVFQAQHYAVMQQFRMFVSALQFAQWLLESRPEGLMCTQVEKFLHPVHGKKL
jgi:hypothetical protein